MNIVGVVTVPFRAKDPSGIKTALEELLALDLVGVIVVHDRKGSGEAPAKTAVEAFVARFAAKGAFLETLSVDEDETTPRWLRGGQKAFENPAVDAVILFACDFDEQPTLEARNGWQAMVKKSARNSLIVGDYRAKSGTFKANFQNLARSAVQVLFPEETAELLRRDLEQWRTEFFSVGRDVYTRVRNSGAVWTFDPTIDLIFACLRNPDFKLEIEKIDFLDMADERDPQGQIWQLTRFAVMLGLNMLRLRPRESDQAKQAKVCRELRDRLKASFDALTWAINRNLPAVPPKDDYADWKAKLLVVAGNDPKILREKLFDGLRKYDPETRRPLDFPGISVIHNIDTPTATRMGFSKVVEQLKRALEAVGLDEYIAFVDANFVHATTFDLINKGDHEAELSRHGKNYEDVRLAVEKAATDWLKETNVELSAPVQIVRVGMFAPSVLKLDLQFHPSVGDIFQAFRLALHKRLGEVDGYFYVRAPEWNRALSAHLTVGYVVKAFDQKQIDTFIAVLKKFNESLQPISFELTQGEVTEFRNMDDYRPVRH